MEKLAAFLEDNVMGRALHTDQLTYRLENGTLEGVYSDQMTFSGLIQSRMGLRFDLFIVSRERIHRLDTAGNRTSLRKDFSGASVFRYELARRKSSGMIIGFMRFDGASVASAPAEAMASQVRDFRLENGEILWQEKELVYRDQPTAEDGCHRPVAFEAACRLYVENGLARYEYDSVCFDVNPLDWSRTPSTASYPKFLARERDATAG